MNNASLTEDQKGEINEFVRDLGQIGYLQCMCSHSAAPVFGIDNRENSRPDGEPNAYVAIRLLYEQHDNKEGYFVFGVYNQEAKYTTQSGAGVFKVNYKIGTTSSKDPLYLYMYKKGADGDKIKNATLENARFEMLFYANKYYINAADALKKGTPTARFVFKTAQVSKVGSSEFKRIAKRDDIDATYGIDFFPKQTSEGEILYDETTNPDKPLYQNDCILPEYKEAYTDYFGSDGTYVIREIESPEGFKLEGEMGGVGKDTNGKDLPSTARVTEGLALRIKTSTTTLDDGIEVEYQQYFINGKEIGESILDASNLPDDVPEETTGAAFVTLDGIDSPILTSNALCLDTMQQYAGSAYGTITVRDSVRVQSVSKIDAKYIVTTKLKDLTDNKFLTVNWKADSNVYENSSTDKEYKTKFSTNDIAAGDAVYFDVSGTLDISGLEGHTLVFINYLLVKEKADGSGTTIWGEGKNNGLGKASSEDDVNEMIYIVEKLSTDIISTQNNRKSATGEGIIYAGKYVDNTFKKGNGNILQELKDTINYEGLEVGKEYTIKGWIVDAETGRNTGIEVEKHQKATAKNGTFDITFQFDATDCGGRKYVSFVEVYDNDHLIFEHKDLNDKHETFFIPQISTKLICEDTGTNVATNAETINFVDTITYKNLMPGVQYKVETEVIDLATGKELVDANGNKASVKATDGIFTAPSENGTHQVHFSLAGVKTDSNGMVTNSIAGKTLVVYQYLYIEKNNNGSGNWVLIADHADKDDKDQQATIKKIGPLYLYMFKRSAGGDTFGNANLGDAIFEVQYYKDQKFDSPSAATRTGNLTATFTFKTASAKDAVLGSSEYRSLAVQNDIDAYFGIDFFPKVDSEGNIIYDESGQYQNDFLTSNNLADYTNYFGQAGTYVIKEIEAPIGYSLSGEMTGYNIDKDTPKVTEGMAVRIAEKVNSEGQIIHEYRLNGKLVENPVVNSGHMPKEENGIALITSDNPNNPKLWSQATCLDTNQQNASSAFNTVSLRDRIWVKTQPKVDSKYFITTKLKDLTTNKFLEVHWEKKSEYSNDSKISTEFKTGFSTNNNGINAGDEVEFDVWATVDGTELAGHTLVFINYVYAKEGANGTGKTVWGADQDGNIKNNGLGEASSEDDKLEMIYFPIQTTDIISTQNGRKGLHGEGIIYAGMYADDSWTKGNGTVMQTLEDTIYYENYKPGRQYTIRAWLMDTETKAPALDANNNEIFNTQASQKQNASDTGDGEWNITFQFDATNCGDRKYVSFVEVYLGSDLVAEYKKLDDSSESFLIPKITTKLKDNETGLDISFAGETVNLTDTISYRKLMTGADYKVKTKVIDMETKKELVD